MSTTIPPLPPPSVPEPSRAPLEHHTAPALSPSDVSYVNSLMGVAPAQIMALIMLKTGVPMPANLGHDIDTSV